MKKRKLRTTGMGILMTVLLSLAGGLAFAAEDAHMKLNLVAKREMARKQEKQRITPVQRKVATEALKAERLKVHQARQAVQQSSPVKSHPLHHLKQNDLHTEISRHTIAIN